MLRRYLVAAVIFAGTSFAHAQSSWPTVRLTTHGRVPQVLGRNDGKFVELYEFDMWLNEAGDSEGYVRRCGAPPYEDNSYDGGAPFDVLPGTYTVFLHQMEWFVRPAVLPNVTVNGAKLDRNIIPALDYACACGGKLGPWERPDRKPWESAKVFHQTFVAKGTSITHAAFKVAGATSKSARVSIHKVTAGRPAAQWEQVGPERVTAKLNSLSDIWVGWRSGEVKTTPGQVYALRVEGLPTPDEAGMAMVVHFDDVGPGYAQGTAYADGVKRPYDIYGMVSSDSDGTVIPYMRIKNTKPGKVGGWGAWAQTWVAQGHSIAAADFLVAWTGDMKGVLAEAQVHEGDSPAGKRIGVPKRGQAAWWGPGSGFLGVAWQPGEVPLEPGKTYCIEWRAAGKCKGYSGGVVNEPENMYPNGIAFRDGKPQPGTDLEMTIIEYSKAVPAVQPRAIYKPAGKNLLTNGDFESGTASQTPKEIPGWQMWQSAKTLYWYGPYGRNNSQAARLIGGSINGTKIDGGLVQKVAGLSSGKTYRLSGWVAMATQPDSKFMSQVGYDPTGQTKNPKASTIIWQGAGGGSNRYEQMVIDNIHPKGDAVSLWLRGANKTPEHVIFTVDFDDFVLEAAE